MITEIEKTPLITAVENCDLQEVKQLITSGVDINEKDENGRTALFHIIGKHISEYTSDVQEIIKLLIASGTDVNATNGSGCTPIMRMVEKRYSNADVTKMLIEAGADVNVKDCTNKMPIIKKALLNKLYDIVPLLIEAGATFDEETNLLYVFYKDDVDALNDLLNKRLNINSICIEDYSAVMLTAKYDSSNILNFLIDRKIDVVEIGKSSDNHGMTTLGFAAHENSTEIVKSILENGVDVNIRGDSGNTPLEDAVHQYKNNIESIEVLIQHGANVNSRDNIGQTPLMSVWSLEVAKYLITHGADVNACDNDGETVLMHRISSSELDIINLLLANGADLNLKNNRGETVLLKAISI